MQRYIALIAFVGSAGFAQAQVVATPGTPSANRILTFDNPAVPTGPIGGSDPVFEAINIAEVRVVPTWTPGGDLLTPGANVNGRALVVHGELAIGEAGDPLDDPEAGAGLDVRFTTLVQRFGVRFVDEINMDYTIELFAEGELLGEATFTYISPSGGFPAPPMYWGDAGRRWFDRIVITSPNGSGGWGLDDLAVGLEVCYPDCDGNGSLDIFDFLCFQNAFVAMDPYGDCDGNGVFDIFDFLCYQDSWGYACP